MVSSLRNSLHRRAHKERSQPLERQKLGVLEKKKDYVERARNYHHKREIVERLRGKAADRNKDEFYFAMKNEKTNRGVHVKYRKNASLTTDIAVVLKAQDANYIRTMRKANLKQIAGLKAQLTVLVDLNEEEVDVLRKAGIISTKGEDVRSGHIVFVDDEEAAWKYEPPQPVASSSRGTKEEVQPEVDLGWIVPSKSKGKEKAKDLPLDGVDAAALKEDSQKNRSKLLKELSARIERDKHLRYAEQELEMQRLTMSGKGAHKKVAEKEQVYTEPDDGDEEFTFRRKNRLPVVELGNEVYKPKVFKWRTERKR